MAYKVYGWGCQTPGCGGPALAWSRAKGKTKPSQWVYKAVVCKQCKRPMKRLQHMEKMHYTLAEML